MSAKDLLSYIPKYKSIFYQYFACSHPSSLDPDAPETFNTGLHPVPQDSDEALALHLQQELDNEAAEARTVDLEEGGLYFCQICQKDLSHMSPEGRSQHLNRSGDWMLYFWHSLVNNSKVAFYVLIVIFECENDLSLQVFGWEWTECPNTSTPSSASSSSSWSPWLSHLWQEVQVPKEPFNPPEALLHWLGRPSGSADAGCSKTGWGDPERPHW